MFGFQFLVMMLMLMGCIGSDIWIFIQDNMDANYRLVSKI